MAAEEHDEERPRLSATPKGSGQPATAGASVPAAAADVPATRGGIARFPGFLRASWAELQRVRWPDRTQVAQGTGVVIVFVLLAGLFLGGVDALASRIVDLII
ncbi:Preprotein translocase subunit SecE (TC 3.A.5.1.1) [Patulibacter medicamentivorans]|jgi:preprotein translocase subunit SecE|uniref:Protein translocase subunit SecE n=1 Tax=Patulibacter medicamentivorans TaxID=1097667 RepID=H0EBX3_9ACTN|nr:preprotein translocase subunit SecE [Patulibacter medicamentivorans]EHN08814.1 Preprotein translocase subunit SecE (TC 3.A.5.1.1) [Patulibacter medicamentivorans]